VEEQLRASWRAALAADPVDSAAADAAFERLVARYREPRRHYHTVKHLAYVLGVADELAAVVPLRDVHSVRLALFFHDAIYEPGASSNEAQSAALARAMLGELGTDAGRIDATAVLIEATARHEAGGGSDAAVVVDADLAILGETPAVYAAYAIGIRAEYGHLADGEWRAGREVVLRHFLDRPAIFSTAPMRAREPRARANLTAELASLALR
jgi:predicted metal-dependent HD superfamily phosphohydrolase